MSRRTQRAAPFIYEQKYVLSETEASRLLEISMAQLVKLRRKGLAPEHLKIRGRFRYSYEGLIAFIQREKHTKDS
jgi:hypothetical protein